MIFFEDVKANSMVFQDTSGKRWKRIKHSTVGLTLLGMIPVVALIGGSLSYHPQWGILPIVHHVTALALPSVAPPPSSKATPTPSAPEQKAVSHNTALASTQLAYQTLATPSGTSQPQSPGSPSNSSIVPASSNQTQTVSSPSQPGSATTTDPTQNNFGRSHKPAK